MHFNLIDLAVLAALVAAAVDASRRDFAFYAGELSALAVGIVVALAGAGLLGGLFQRVLGVQPGLSGFAAFLLLLVVVHGVVQVATQAPITRVAGRLRDALSARHWRLASAVPGAGVAALLSLLLVGALTVLPNAGVRQLVQGSAIGSAVMGAGIARRPLSVFLIPTPTPSIVVTAPESNPGEDAFYKLHFPPDLQIELDSDAERTMLREINQARSARGLTTLRLSPALQKVARDHSRDMYERHYFSHRTPEGLTPYDRLRAQHISYVTAGENIAFAPDADQAWQALMSSPDHRANILNQDYRCVGIGAYRGLNGFEEMVTQEFDDCSA